MQRRLKKIKSLFLALISGASLIVMVWFLLFGKIKASEYISPLMKKIPQSQGALVEMTENVLGEAAQNIKKEDIEESLKKGSQVFEESDFTGPIREIREDIKRRADEVFEEIKNLPSQQVRTIKEQVCKEWLEEERLATQSGR